MKSHVQEPQLSVVIAFYNMRREARRTLYTLMAEYQEAVSASDYEVIVVESGSPEPLDGDWVEALQSGFRYERIEPHWPAPCEAMNRGISLARAPRVMCLVDGARMLSPGVLVNTLRAFKLFPHAYVHTVAFHLGSRRQDQAMVEEGYDQVVEDELLAQVDWQTDGYRLFDVSCLAGSSVGGYLSGINESNCFAVDRDILRSMGGFDEAFVSPGGGLVNLDLHRRLMMNQALQPVMLLGQATFHQFHGGVATNSANNHELVEGFKREYEQIRGQSYQPPAFDRTFYLGAVYAKSRKFLHEEVAG